MSLRTDCRQLIDKIKHNTTKQLTDIIESGKQGRLHVHLLIIPYHKELKTSAALEER